MSKSFAVPYLRLVTERPAPLRPPSHESNQTHCPCCGAKLVTLKLALVCRSFFCVFRFVLIPSDN